MKYKATLGATSILVTIVISLLLVFVIAFFTYRIIVSKHIAEMVMAVLIIAFISTLYIITYLYRPKFYLLEKDNLIIRRPIKDVKISLHQIKDAFIVRKESMIWTERVGGNGGLFGFYGKFKNNFGLTTWYATKLKNYILIDTVERGKIIITPDDVEMVKVIRQYLTT